MPSLKLKGLEVAESTLERIENNLGLGVYEVIEQLEQSAQDKLNEIISESRD